MGQAFHLDRIKAGAVGRGHGADGVADGCVLEDEQRVEHRPVAMLALQLRQAEIADVTHHRGLPLQLHALLEHRGASADLVYHRHGVDEQPHHALDARKLFGTAGDDRAEHHVLAVGEPAEQHRPGEQHRGVEGETVGSGPLPQSCGVGGRQQQLRGLRHAGARRGTRLGQHQRTGCPPEVFDPFRDGRGVVLFGKPDDVVAVERCRRQSVQRSPGAVYGEHLGEEHRQRPPVHQNVVDGQDHSPAGLPGHRQQYYAQRRASAQVEWQPPLRPCDRLEFVGSGDPFGPRQFGVRRHDLHRPGHITVPERDAQVRVTVQQGLGAAAQQRHVNGAVDVDDELHAVKVDVVVGQPVQREQPLLQRTQRKHIFDLCVHDCCCQDAVSDASASASRPDALIGV